MAHILSKLRVAIKKTLKARRYPNTAFLISVGENKKPAYFRFPPER